MHSLENAPATMAMAMVTSSFAPLMMLDSDLTIVAVSHSFCRAFALDPAAVIDRKLDQLGAGEWGSRSLASLLRAVVASAPIDSYEMDLKRPGLPNRNLSMHAQLIECAGVPPRVLLAVTDLTEILATQKAKDQALREKSVLLQELQHRVANSLQIIASVLLLSARRMPSDESRAYLNDAHHRVMSVAAMQRQLAVTQLGDVELRQYLTELCQSIAASMIADHEQLSLDVTVDDTVVSAEISVSLGLITTELVINALKHAFPDHRKGGITVDYRTIDEGWSLRVTDDGVGISAVEVARPGLGTSIVNALAMQLKAEVVISDNHSGTVVEVRFAPETEAGAAREAVVVQPI